MSRKDQVRDEAPIRKFNPWTPPDLKDPVKNAEYRERLTRMQEKMLKDDWGF